MTPKIQSILVLAACALGVATPAAAQPQVTVNGVTAPDTVSAAAGGALTVAVTGGPGNATDWVGLYVVGAQDGTYQAWRYLNGSTAAPATGLADASVMLFAPVAPGTYELRFFASNGYTRLATSGNVTVVPSAAVLTLNGIAPPVAVTVLAGTVMTVGVSGGPGNANDWVALASSTAGNSAYLDWRYVNDTTVPPAAGTSSGTVTFQVPGPPGTYEVRFFAHDGYERLATSAPVTVVASSAEIVVDGASTPTSVTVSANASVVVDVMNGPGNARDWVGLYAAGAPDGAFLRWWYLNGTTTAPLSGLTAATISVVMPTTAGSYEVRFFANNSYARLATSTTIIVAAPASTLVVNGVAAPTTVTVAAGSVAVVSVSDGPGNPTDWVALYAVGAADSAYLDWRYLNDTAVPPSSGATSGTLHFSMPTAPGDYEFRFFAADGYGVLATSATITVAAPAAQVVINGPAPPTAVSVMPGSAVTVTVSGGPGNARDWVALAGVGSGNASYLSWQYLNGSTVPPETALTGGTVTFQAPFVEGPYEFRLFANDGFSRLATSGTLTVGTSQATVTIALTSPFEGTTFVAPISLTLEADVTVANGSITRVDFFSGSTLVGTIAAPPYQVNWLSPPVGFHVLTAVATDNTDSVTTSPVVTVSVASSGEGFGTLGAPTVDPPVGLYGPNTSVRLSAAAGATIRYTTDATAPTPASSVYTTPILLTGSATVQAQAYQDGWTPSPITTRTYQIDSSPPVISAHLSPSPNPAGWNNTAVTVTFTCADQSQVLDCPAPVTLSQEGAGQLVTATATDTLGNQGILSLTVNIDVTPPIVTMSAPSHGLVTDITTMPVQGSANDASGPPSVLCNSQLATMANDAAECIVNLRPGQNSIVMSAVDAAGNVTSTGARVTHTATPSSLTITPSRLTLGLGETRVLTVLTDSGAPPADVTWAFSSPGIVSFSPDNDRTITANTVGEVTITVTSGSLSAEVTVTVLAGALAPGDTRWCVLPSPGLWLRAPISAHPVSDDDPDLFSVEFDQTDTAVTVRAIRAVDGAQVWAEAAPGTPLLADMYGGILTRVPGLTEFGSGIRRLSGGDARPWEYQSPGWIDSVAQNSEGRIFLMEYVYTSPLPDGFGYNSESSIVGLDGNTGQRLFRVPLPVSTSIHTAVGACSPPWGAGNAVPRVTYGGGLGPIAISADGDAFVELQEYHDRWTGVCQFGEGTLSRSQKLSLLRISPGGAVTNQVLGQWGVELPDTQLWVWGVGLDGGSVVGPVTPDVSGGVFATWTWVGPLADPQSPAVLEGRVSHVRNGVVTDHVVPSFYGSSDSPVAMVSDDGTAYLRDSFSGTLTAMAINTWTAKWSMSNAWVPVVALDGGGALVSDDGGSIVQVEDNGTVATTVLGAPWRATLALRGHGLIHGVDQAGMLSAVSMPDVLESAQAVIEGRVNQCTPAKLLGATPTKHKGLVPRAEPYTYKFVENFPPNDPRLWNDEQKAAVRAAFVLWNATNASSGLTTRFREFDASVGDTQEDIALRKQDLSLGTGTDVAGAFIGRTPFQPDRRIVGGVIFFTTNEQFLHRGQGYQKVALHEIGHALGLEHPWGPGPRPSSFQTTRGGTVMNSLGFPNNAPLGQRRDDAIGNVPNAPTACDRKGVFDASTF